MSHDERVRNPPPLPAADRWFTSRCFQCDTFFDARTIEAARSMLESHQAREGHERTREFPVRRPSLTTAHLGANRE